MQLQRCALAAWVLARSIEDRTLADELREAAKDIALSLGHFAAGERCMSADKAHKTDEYLRGLSSTLESPSPTPREARRRA